MLNTILLVLLLLGQIMLLALLWRMRGTLTHYHKLVADRTMSHQAQIRVSNSSKPHPKVDAKARTTRRDSNDLPATGRSSSIGITRR